ncbi:tetratricopeptide repeat protein [Rickettsia endosymbiont of Gonocerus acuteangulatus]|uniref:tetratricopeptide repeat protein n=1 Tax=Rickettsia endosymbiont of Gonocerus acuteangulatus TaxID=3066266 RepID=UPI003132FE5D
MLFTMLLKKSLPYRIKLYQSNHPMIAESLKNIGFTYCQLSDVSEGLKYFELALKIEQQLYQGNHRKVALSLHNIGFTYYKLGNISKGIKYFEDALKMYKALYQINHPYIATSLDNISVIYQDLGDANKVVELKKQAYLIFIRSLSLDHLVTKLIKSYLEKASPEFIKNNETREFILQRGDFEEVTLEVKQRIQKKF